MKWDCQERINGLAENVSYKEYFIGRLEIYS